MTSSPSTSTTHPGTSGARSAPRRRRTDTPGTGPPPDPAVRSELLAVAVVAAVGTAIVAATWLVARSGDQSFGDLSRDPNAVSGSPPSNGMLSLLGIGLWGTAVGGAALAAMTSRRTDAAGRWAWAAWAALSGLLLVDDGLQLHETFLPNRGVPEWLTFGLYGVAALTAGIALVREVRSFAISAALAAAVAALGASFAIDIVFADRSSLLVEDGLKFVGIGLWAFGTLRAAQVRRSA